jgi:hypothetical protein
MSSISRTFLDILASIAGVHLKLTHSVPTVESRFNGSGGNVCGRVFRNRQGAVTVFVETCNPKACTGLTTYLIFEQMAEFKRLAFFDELAAFLFGQAVEVGIWQRMTNLKFFAFNQPVVEQINQGIDEACEQDASLPQDPKRFLPNRAHVRDEQIGAGMKDEIKALVSKHGKVGHVAFDCDETKTFSLRNPPVLLQLLRRIVEHGDCSSRRREDWSLLASARSKAENFKTIEIGKPLARDGLRLRQEHFPLSPSGGGNHFRADSPCPFVPTLDFVIPCGAIVLSNVHLMMFWVIRPDSFYVGIFTVKQSNDDHGLCRVAFSVDRDQAGNA